MDIQTFITLMPAVIMTKNLLKYLNVIEINCPKAFEVVLSQNLDECLFVHYVVRRFEEVRCLAAMS